MDFRFNSCGFWVLLHTVFTLISVINAKDCRMCKPGYYASRHCTEHHDTVCKPCSRGTFSSVYNVFKTCSQCSSCDVGEFVLKPCSKHSDTVCESCSAVTDIAAVTEQFLRDCLQTPNDQPGPNLDNIQTDGVKLNNPQESNSAPDQVNVIYEGSGAAITEVSPSERNGTEEEGSGVIPVIDETDKNFTSVILPDETEGTETYVTELTTKKTGSVLVDEGIKLQNDTDKQKTDIVLGSGLPTTIKTIGNGGGIVISEPKTATVENVDVYIEENQEEATDHYEYEPQPPHTGASKRQEEKDGGTSIGVVVTVGLVAALVFFILGFLASKFWNGRRERTFNVMEAERLNGKAGVECSGIEYKDGDERPRNKSGIYDEIPASTKLNGSTPDPERGSAPIYSKPIKRETAPSSSAAPPSAVNPPVRKDGEWAGFSMSRNSSSGSLILQPRTVERPVSEIRYIDEVDDAETDRLLQPPAAGNDVANMSSSSSASEVAETKTNQDTEKTPMISGQEKEKS